LNKWTLTLIMILIVSLSLIGCSTMSLSSNIDESPVPNGTALDFIVEDKPFPSPVAEVLEVVRKTGGVRAVTTQQRTYIIIALGERSTTGYSVKVKSVIKQATHLQVTYIEKKPGPNDVVAQVLTYPYIVISVPQSNLPVRFEKR
jgi:uncharacterized lipoprotein YehR (DUF1307 family)